MKRIISVLLAVMMLCSLLTGCGSDDAIGGTQKPDVDNNGLKVNEVVSGPIDPLTGETVSEYNSSARPYCVMINNHSHARPCKGLSNASIVYEALVEGSITRMMAVFSDINDVTVGAIRSSRPYYVSLVQAYDAIYVHAGGSDQAYSDISNYDIDHIDYCYGHAPSAFFRDQDRLSNGVSTEHTLFAKGTKLVEYANEKEMAAEHDSDFDTSYGLTFSPDAVSQCESSSNAFTVYYYGSKGASNTSTTFKFDSSKNAYNAFISGKEYTDGDSTSIDFANVIILNVPTKTVDNYGHQSMELTGSGSGYFCCGGKYVEINWSRDGRDDSFHYTLTDGTPLALGVGKTFISIAPLDSTGGVDWDA